MLAPSVTHVFVEKSQASTASFTVLMRVVLLCFHDSTCLNFSLLSTLWQLSILRNCQIAHSTISTVRPYIIKYVGHWSKRRNNRVANLMGKELGENSLSLNLYRRVNRIHSHGTNFIRKL